MSSTTVKILNNEEQFVHVAVDLAKNQFQVAYKDPTSGKFINRQYKRSEFKEFVTRQDTFKKRFYVESCGACQYWCRLALAMGHNGTVIPASATKTFISNNKSDCNDAKAIWQLSFVPDIKEIHVRSEANQVMGMVLKCREKLIAEKTKIANWLRGQLYELGEITSLGGSEKVLTLSNEVLSKALDSKKEWADMYKLINSSIESVINSIDTQLESIDKFIKDYVATDTLCKKLMTMPYIGPVNAYALAYVMEDPKYYKNGREFAAKAGISPSFTGTGGEVRILGVGKKGCTVLKRTIYQPALMMYQRNKVNCEGSDELKGKRTTNSIWISKMADRKPLKKVVCAICNKMAWIAWTIAADGNCCGYDDSKTSLIYQIKRGDTDSIDKSAEEQLN